MNKTEAVENNINNIFLFRAVSFNSPLRDSMAEMLVYYYMNELDLRY